MASRVQAPEAGSRIGGRLSANSRGADVLCHLMFSCGIVMSADSVTGLYFSVGKC